MVSTLLSAQIADDSGKVLIDKFSFKVFASSRDIYMAGSSMLFLATISLPSEKAAGAPKGPKAALAAVEA